MFHRLLKKLSRDNSGNTAVIFTLALMPLLAGVGTGIDYSRATNARASMQVALDGTALALSKEAASLTPTQLNLKATDTFAGLFNRPDVTNVVVTPSYTNGGASVLTVTAKGDFPTYIMPAVGGVPSVQINSSSTVSWGNTRLRVALVLDNTGSMASSNKLTALKNASHSLLSQLRGLAVNTGDVYVSIIPFSKDVNVGSGNSGAPWVRWDAALWDETNGSCSNSTYKTKTSCTSHGKAWTVAAHNTWNGCVTDRDQNYDTDATAPSAATPATLFPAEQYANCPVQLMGLSYDWSTLNSKIDAMYAAGNTNQTVGLQWGYQSLVANSPLAVPPMDPTYKYQQVVILLTDGLNTENRWSTTQNTIDLRTRQACDTIKAATIMLFTVQVNTGGDPASTMLQQCATDADKFFLLTDPNQIVTTFDKIATTLSPLRLTQ